MMLVIISVFREKKMITNEHNLGLSGCKLNMISDVVIRKTSSDVSYNERLQKQIEKQRAFSQYNIANIKVPKIISDGIDSSGLFYAEMEYSNGKTFSQKFSFISPSNIDEYSNILTSYLTFCKSTQTGQYENDELKTIFQIKLQSLLKTKTSYRLFISYMLKQLDVIQFHPIPKTICHGDLTFSNMLFTNTNIHLLDFLDSYIESYYTDLIKLKQDLHYYWSINLMNDDSNTLRCRQIFRKMWNDISSFQELNDNTSMFLDAINYLRIEPYVKTNQQHKIFRLTTDQTKLYANYYDSTHRRWD